MQNTNKSRALTPLMDACTKCQRQQQSFPYDEWQGFSLNQLKLSIAQTKNMNLNLLLIISLGVAYRLAQFVPTTRDMKLTNLISLTSLLFHPIIKYSDETLINCCNSILLEHF